jgi:phosphoglycerate kinase
MKSLTTLSVLKNKTVLVRVDYNVPLQETKSGTKILDARRIEASYKTIDFLVKKGARVVLIAHLGKGEESPAPIATFLKKKYPLTFITENITDPLTKETILAGKPGALFLLENIRQYPGEEKNEKAFAKGLASLADSYVNDAFSVSHRAHASVVGVAKLLPSYAGFQLEAEVKALSAVIEHPKHPFLFILGGAKFGTKIPLLKRFATLSNEIVIAGAIMNSFYKVSGFEVGNSVVDDGYDKEIKNLLNTAPLLMPIDVLVLRDEKKITCTPYEVQKGDVIVDIGPQSVALIVAKIKKAKLIVWNGPTGWYEKGFTKATVDIAKGITESKAQAIIGGGDTGAVVDKIARGKKNIFVSTGGGATLDYLANGTLPGITALGK